MPVTIIRLSTCILAMVAILAPAHAQNPTGPARPAKYDVTIRYRISADRDGRIDQFQTMSKFLDTLGFKATPRPDADLDQFDLTAEKLTGTIPGNTATKLIEDPRIKTVILAPAGYAAPDDNTKPVQISVTLTSNLTGSTQRKLHEQTVARLQTMGFREGLAYDHRGFTRVRGAMAAKTVPELLKDLRRLPAGWFVAEVPADTTDLPFRNVLPIRIVEILPAAPDTTSTADVKPAIGKLTPDAKALLADPLNAGKPARLELVLDNAIEGSTRDFRDHLRFVAPTATIEGMAGPVVSVRVEKPAEAEALARITEVRSIRAPRSASGTAKTSTMAAKDVKEWLKSSGVARLHALNLKGLGSKIVILAGDWTGAQDLIGKELPARTKLMDLTAELTPTVEPLPIVANGSGLAAAVAAFQAAPEAELILVRVDPAAFHQLLTVARAIAGDKTPSEGIRSRVEDFAVQNQQFVERRRAVMAEYETAITNLSDDEKVIKRRTDAVAAVKKLDAEQARFQTTFDRLKGLKKDLDTLAGATIVVNTLAWDSGVPNDGLNALHTVLEQKFVAPPVTSGIRTGPTRKTPIWVQAASGSVGAVWAGPLMDTDGNGVMEFNSFTDKRPTGVWTPELNFVTLLSPGSKTPSSLPAGAKIRFTMQWREPVDADMPTSIPETGLVLKLLRQVDATGAKVNSDEMIEVARTTAIPVKLFSGIGGAVYEQTLDANIPEAGEYAIRVEILPSIKTELGARKVKSEIYPRITVDASDAATRAKGRVVFRTFAPTDPGVGAPGDSLIALTVGADMAGLSATGAGPGMGLRTKPEIVAPATVTVGGKVYAGPAVSAGYIAGALAAMAGTGVKPIMLLRDENALKGQDLVLPKVWLDSLGNK